MEAAARGVAAAQGLGGPGRDAVGALGGPNAGIKCADALRYRRGVAVSAAARAHTCACCAEPRIGCECAWRFAQGDAYQRSYERGGARKINFLIICCMHLVPIRCQVQCV